MKEISKICPICGSEKKPMKNRQVYKLKTGEVKEYNYTQWRCQKKHIMHQVRKKMRDVIKDTIRFY